MQQYDKRFNMSLAEVPSPRPATNRILLESTIDGRILIHSTLTPEETIEALDGAMEAIDGQRLPPREG